MSYNKNDFFAVKGRIGELIYMNYITYTYGVLCEDPEELQKVGIDVVISDSYLKKRVDVKLSDKLEDIFSVVYHNGNDYRFPYRPHPQADCLGIVVYDWEKYMNENLKNLSKFSEEDMKKKLETYVDTPALDKLIEAIVKSKNDTLIGLKELYIAHRTRHRLQIERDRGTTYKDTERLFSKGYVVSIKDIQLSAILEPVSNFRSKKIGSKSFDSSGSLVVKKDKYYTRFGAITVAVYGWKAIEDNVEVVYDQPKEITTIKPIKSSKKVKSETIAFGQYSGTLISELPDEYLGWLTKGAHNPGSQLSLFKEELARRKA